MINPVSLRESKLLSFKLKQKGIFTNKMIFNLLIPILVEQTLIVAIEIADTVMVAHVGETALAGMSSVAPFNNLIQKIMSGLAIGGSIIISQYIGKQKRENAKETLKMAFYFNLLFAMAISAILFVTRFQFLSLLIGNIEDGVMENARTYFVFSLLSYPFFAMYFVVSAAYRAMRNSKIPMTFTAIMLGGNLLLKATFIYGFNWGVFGAGLSTFLSVMFIGVMMTITICRKSDNIYIEKITKPNFNFPVFKKIMAISVPTSIENGMFQLGLVVLQRLTVSYGVTAIAANAIVGSLAPISYLVPASFSLVIVTVVSQCMGAGEPEQASMYAKHILKLNYCIGLFMNIAGIALNQTLVGGFGLSPETTCLAMRMFYIYCTGSAFLYPISFVLPNALRASGDIRFTMAVSLASMFGARIGMAFVLGRGFNLGVMGNYLAMQIDWIIRSAIFIYRFKQGKWKHIKLV